MKINFEHKKKCFQNMYCDSLKLCSCIFNLKSWLPNISTFECFSKKKFNIVQHVNKLNMIGQTFIWSPVVLLQQFSSKSRHQTVMMPAVDHDDQSCDHMGCHVSYNPWHMHIYIYILTCWIVLKIIKDVFTFWIVCQGWFEVDEINFRTIIYRLSYTANTRLGDASAGMVLMSSTGIFHFQHQKSSWYLMIT